MTVKTETFQHPECADFHAALIVFSNAAEIVVVGTADENERYLVSRTRVVEHAIWTNLDVVLEAVRRIGVPIDRLAYFHRGQFDAGMQLVEKLNEIVPTVAVRAAKEDLAGEDRPLLFVKFGHRLGRVGVVTAGRLAKETIRNVEIGPNDLSGIAIAAEEYERPIEKFTRKAKVRPSRPTLIHAPSFTVEDDLRRRIEELEAKVTALVSVLLEKEVEKAA